MLIPVIGNGFFARYYPRYKSGGIARWLKRRRYEFILQTVGLSHSKGQGLKILEIGCSTGADFAQFATKDFDYLGVDLTDQRSRQHFAFEKGDATNLRFENKAFDMAVSIGVFEHIIPLEQLCLAVSEIDRVAKSFCIVVPCITTILEPHNRVFFWALRDAIKPPASGLTYLSNAAWLSFKRTQDCRIATFRYLPFLKMLAVFRPYIEAPEFIRAVQAELPQ